METTADDDDMNLSTQHSSILNRTSDSTKHKNAKGARFDMSKLTTEKTKEAPRCSPVDSNSLGLIRSPRLEALRSS